MEKINLITIGHPYVPQYRNILLQFFPSAKIQVNGTEHDLKVCIRLEDRNINISFNGFGDKYNVYVAEIKPHETVDKAIKRHLVLALKRITRQENPWGVLTGIRPVKIPHKLFMEGKTKDQVEDILKNEYILSKDKISMITSMADREIKTMYPLDKNKVMLYIGIPFCPSRCYYCSFISQVSKENEELISLYLKALLKELEFILSYLKNKNVQVINLYIGGGTPTVLNPHQIQNIFTVLYKYFPKTKLKEISFEGGRPDTINKSKLRLLKDFGVNRICINTQTLNNKTLEIIGRNHTATDFYMAMDEARSIGFDSINTDLILGFENETIEDMQNSVKRTVLCKPENITIHNLSLKRSSTLHHEGQYTFQSNDVIQQINQWTRTYLEENNYSPYYLYRQKYTQGNVENIGYTIKGKECLYNIGMISEKISVIGVGAGSSGKLFDPFNNKLERMETVKNPQVYIEKLQKICDKKIFQMDKLW